jgi:hypothetical protein
MTAEVVPFGKYRGQPVEVLAADHDYCEWLTAQPWFKARYLNVYNTVINYGAEPQDSPEHNQMQARFLDDAWCFALASLLKPERSGGPEEILNRGFERGGWDVAFSVYGPPGYVDYASGSPFRRKPCPHDAGCTECVQQCLLAARVECKPDLGDDYPTVLRQVQRYMSADFTGTPCVLVRRHAFTGVTWEQVREIFAASRIELLTEDDIDPRDGAA